jgi:hypothetical protein
MWYTLRGFFFVRGMPFRIGTYFGMPLARMRLHQRAIFRVCCIAFCMVSATIRTPSFLRGLQLGFTRH